MSDNTLVSLEELADRLPFQMNDDDTREAQGALDDLSNDARHYGLRLWDTPDKTPAPVRNLILRAAQRHMKNYEGYVQSRAGDEMLMWTDRGEDAGAASFTRSEQQKLSVWAGNQRSLTTSQITSYGSGARRLKYADGGAKSPTIFNEVTQ